MIPAPGELLHFSEDPGIQRFVPHVAATARQPEAFVWTVDPLNSPCYWFPRQCPRVCSWTMPGAEGRVHAIEESWVDAMGRTTLHAYRFAAEDFEAFGDRPHAYVSSRPVEPLGPPVAVHDLVGLHARHGIDLRVVPDLQEWFVGVRERGLEFSGIRLGNAGIGPGGPFPTRR